MNIDSILIAGDLLEVDFKDIERFKVTNQHKPTINIATFHSVILSGKIIWIRVIFKGSYYSLYLNEVIRLKSDDLNRVSAFENFKKYSHLLTI